MPRRKVWDTPALYTYESDVVGLLVSATEPYCLFPPCITCMANREVIGIVTKIHSPDANVKLATSWLELAGCKKIFYVDSRQQEAFRRFWSISGKMAM